MRIRKRALYPNLLAEMARNCEDQVILAEILGITRGTMNLKLNGKAHWKKEEIDIICKHFNKTYEEIFK